MTAKTWFAFMTFFAFASIICFFQIDSYYADVNDLNTGFLIGGILLAFVAIFGLIKVIKNSNIE